MNRIMLYQVLPRLYGNTHTPCVPNGTLEENHCGKLADFTPARLRRIRESGYTHIWYTGLLAHATMTDYSAYGIRRDNPRVVKGRAGSPYAIKDYYDIDPDLAQDPLKRMEEFEALVERTHQAGLKVVMDFVPNHVAREYHGDARPAGTADLGADDRRDYAFHRDNNFYYLPSEPLHLDHVPQPALSPEEQGDAAVLPAYQEYPARATGNDRFTAWPDTNDWYETVKLNYGVDYLGGGIKHFPLAASEQRWDNVPSTWRKMTDILRFWAAKGVDAFRCDMAEMVPMEFWGFATSCLKREHPQLLFIAEVYNPDLYRSYIHQGGFDYLYDKVGLYDTLRGVVRGERSAEDITRCWQCVDNIRPHMLSFLENHDEQRIASPFFAGDPVRALPALIVAASFTTGPFMVYAGQELGEPAADAEGFSGMDGRTSIFDYWSVPSLRKLLRGKSHFTQEERRLFEVYAHIISMQNAHAALREGAFFDLQYANLADASHYDPRRQYAFLRSTKEETILVVANFDAAPRDVLLNLPEHAFACLGLEEGQRSAANLMTGKRQSIAISASAPLPLPLPAHSAAVLAFKTVSRSAKQ